VWLLCIYVAQVFPILWKNQKEEKHIIKW
jgi:hypothetical protein